MQEELAGEMATETETTQASPFHAHLCLDRLCLGRLADRGPVRHPRLERGLRLGRLALP